MLSSTLPGALAIRPCAHFLSRHDRIFEHRQELFVILGVEKEDALVEDCFLGAAESAVQHKFRKLLPPQHRGAGENCLCISRSPHLNHVVFAAGGAFALTVGMRGLAHWVSSLKRLWK